jgi:hypothetical protein
LPIFKPFSRMDERIACSMINPVIDGFLTKSANEARRFMSAKLKPSSRSWSATASRIKPHVYFPFSSPSSSG